MSCEALLGYNVKALLNYHSLRSTENVKHIETFKILWSLSWLYDRNNSRVSFTQQDLFL
jgi:hypothetical protein